MNTEDGFTGPINIGNPNEITINKLAEIILKLTNSKSKIIYCKLPEDDPKRRNPNIKLAMNKLDWNPSFDLEIGIMNTIRFFKNLNEAN